MVERLVRTESGFALAEIESKPATRNLYGKNTVLDRALALLQTGNGLGDYAVSVQRLHSQDMADWLVFTLWRAGRLGDLFAHCWFGMM